MTARFGLRARHTGKRGAANIRRRGPSTGLARLVFALILLALALGSAFGLGPSPAAEEPISEYQVKAAFLLNFTRFVEWPSTAFAQPDSPLSICILGDDPFGELLRQVVEGESVGGRNVAVLRIRKAPAPKTCHVLFISRSEKDVGAILSAAGPGVLTVSDRELFLREGGMIAFVVEDRRVRFDVSQRAALRASLAMSSRLLAVARSVQK
jgi:hypothetical protein